MWTQIHKHLNDERGEGSDVSVICKAVCFLHFIFQAIHNSMVSFHLVPDISLNWFCASFKAPAQPLDNCGLLSLSTNFQAVFISVTRNSEISISKRMCSRRTQNSRAHYVTTFTRATLRSLWFEAMTKKRARNTSRTLAKDISIAPECPKSLSNWSKRQLLLLHSHTPSWNRPWAHQES